MHGRLKINQKLFSKENPSFQQSDSDRAMQEPGSQPSGSETPNIESDRADYPVNASSSDDSISTHVGSSSGPSDEISSKTALTSDGAGPSKPSKPKKRPGKGKDAHIMTSKGKLVCVFTLSLCRTS